MKRGARCVVQTINLSNPKTCTRPKVERLISADVDSSCDPNRAGDYWTPRPVAVRACSWRDARRKCSPKFHGPPQKKASSLPLSTGEKLYRVVAFFVKGAIVTGLIYWTYTEGLWGDSTETEDLYYRMASVIFPDRPDLSHLKGVKCSAIETYNHMIVKGMDIIISVPRDAYRRLRDFLYPYDTTTETKGKPAKSTDEYSTEA